MASPRSPRKDEWVELVPPDEYSLDNPANTSNGRRNRLVRLDRDNSSFAEVEQLFVKGWRHRKKARPDIQYIFKVLWPESALEPFLDYRCIFPSCVLLSLIYYRDRVQTTLKAKDKRGNEKLLFHGTNRACLLGESSASVLLCGLQQCYLCSIVRSSFDVSKCGRSIRSLSLPALISLSGSKNSFKRFGHGIYTTSCSSKADDYVSNLPESGALRVMILSRVVVGRPYKRYRNAPDLVAPPSGYDSIAGEIGWDLNYEETVTYDNDTVRPAYLIVYGDKPRRVPNLKAFVQTIFKTPLVS
ncbi:ADP-ribosylation [Lanmaoa asiatica]|nr:ADP-ribosylation [Lanmaoa asiatica]